jgi:hypothetical protein
MDVLPSLILPHCGQCHMADMRPLALDACEDISCLCTYLFMDFYLKHVAFYRGATT